MGIISLTGIKIVAVADGLLLFLMSCVNTGVSFWWITHHHAKHLHLMFPLFSSSLIFQNGLLQSEFMLLFKFNLFQLLKSEKVNVYL